MHGSNHCLLQYPDICMEHTPVIYSNLLYGGYKEQRTEYCLTYDSGSVQATLNSLVAEFPGSAGQGPYRVPELYRHHEFSHWKWDSRRENVGLTRKMGIQWA